MDIYWSTLHPTITTPFEQLRSLGPVCLPSNVKMYS